MKTGLRLYHRYRILISYINYVRFILRSLLIGFDAALLFLERVDRYSVRLILTKYGAKIGNNVDIQPGIVFHNCKDFNNLSINDNSHIGKKCFLIKRSH